MKIDLSSTDLLSLPIPKGVGTDRYEDVSLAGYSLSIDYQGNRKFHVLCEVDESKQAKHKDRPNGLMMYVVGDAGVDSEVIARKCAEILLRMAKEGFLPWHGKDFAELDNLRVPALQDIIRALQREREELLMFLAIIERDRNEMRQWMEK